MYTATNDVKLNSPKEKCLDKTVKFFELILATFVSKKNLITKKV